MANPNKTAGKFLRAAREVDPSAEAARSERRRAGNPELYQLMDDVSAGRLTPAEAEAKLAAMSGRS